MKISLIIPMYNESSIIKETAKQVHEYMSVSFSDYEVIFFDDGSNDGCGNMVREMDYPNIRVSTYDGNHGKGAAVRAAMMEALGDVRIFTDADLAYGLEVVGKMVREFEEHPNIQVLLGSRNLDKNGYEGYSKLRKLMSKIYIKILCLIGGFRLSDSQCGIKAFRAESAENIFSRLTVDGFAFDFEAILWACELHYNIAEMPVRVINHRESKVHIIRDTVRMLSDLRKIRKNVRKQVTNEKAF